MSTRLSLVSHFFMATDEIGPFAGMQAKATLLFNLDAFRHPRENASQPRRPSNGRRAGGPVFTL